MCGKLGKSLRQRTWRILRNQTLFRRMVLSSQRKYIPRHASRRFSLDSKFAAMKSTLGKSPILKDTPNRKFLIPPEVDRNDRKS